jgi:formylglycine-generating enzyme required for sulfatase activity/serine/threonine protein kinase
VFPAEQLDQLNAWLGNLTTAYQDLLDKLDGTLTVPDQASDPEVRRLLKGALSRYDDLAGAFAAHQVEIRRQTLSLTLVEQQLDAVLHGQHQLAASLEDLKTAFIHSPLWTDWQQFRKARPEAVAALVQADECFLAGQRDQGTDLLLRLLKERGVGTATLARRLGLEYLSRGQVAPARHYYDGACKLAGAAKTRTPALVRTATMLDTASSRASRVAGWRCLPRGLVLNHQFRVEDEVGRGGMASVYRVVGVDAIWGQRDLALKVPAPPLMADEATCQRFLQEIKVNLQLAQRPHPAIVQTFQHLVLMDPHTGRKLYGIVMEFVPGRSLAQLLAERQADKQFLAPAEVLGYLRPVCQALTHAHALGILHRDLKPHNVMVTPDGQARLMDFGIARLLGDRLSELTRTGQPMTPVYAPPEAFGGGAFDAQSDVYLLGNLLLELLTFQPKCDPAEARPDAPEGWLELIAAAMSVSRRLRPKSSADFLARLEAAISPRPSGKGGEPGVSPLPVRGEGSGVRGQDDDDWLGAGDRIHADAQERHQRARSLVEQQNDYEGAIQLLEPIPAELRNAALFTEYHQKRDRVRLLLPEVKEAWKTGRHQGLRKKARELSDLLPLNAQLRQILPRLPLDAGDVAEFDLGGGVKLRMAYVPAGTFWMGGGGGQPGSQQVAIPHDFYLGVFPVTQGQWQAVMGNNPSYFARSGGGKDKVQGISEADLAQFPVEQVSWEDAQQFLNRLNAREKNSGWLYRLPTEAEWEYACRGGARSPEDCSYHFYLDRPGNALSSTQANFNGNHPDGDAATGPYLERTSKVGSYQPNQLGIYDMHGNVWEWCEDSHDGGSGRVIRGGSWISHGSYCRAANRSGGAPALRSNNLGLRLARVPSGR